MKQSVYKSEEARDRFRAAYNGILSALPFSQRTVDTPYGETFLLEAGGEDKPAVLLLHGSCSNSVFWTGDMFALMERHRVLAVDIPGEAGNSSEFRLNLDGDDYAQWIRSLLDALHLERVSLAGNSLGGWMALKFATAYPERVDKLMLFASGGLAQVKTDILEKAKRSEETGESLTMEEGAAGSGALPKEVLDFMNLILASYNPINVPLPVFSPAALRRLNMPVLYVTGDRDDLLDAQASLDAVRDNIPQAEIHLLPNTGHMITTPHVWMLPFLTKA